MAASFGGGIPLVDGFGVPSIFFAARKSNSKPMLAVNAHQNRFVRIIRFSIQFWQAKKSSYNPTAPPGAHSFYCFFPQPPPSAAPPPAFSKNYFFHRSSRDFFAKDPHSAQTGRINFVYAHKVFSVFAFKAGFPAFLNYINFSLVLLYIFRFSLGLISYYIHKTFRV